MQNLHLYLLFTSLALVVSVPALRHRDHRRICCLYSVAGAMISRPGVALNIVCIVLYNTEYYPPNPWKNTEGVENSFWEVRSALNLLGSLLRGTGGGGSARHFMASRFHSIGLLWGATTLHRSWNPSTLRLR